jgi:hypothetical protein
LPGKPEFDPLENVLVPVFTVEDAFNTTSEDATVRSYLPPTS